MHPLEFFSLVTVSKGIYKADGLAVANMTLQIRGVPPTLVGITDETILVVLSMNFKLDDVEIEMSTSSATIFNYVQQLIQPFPSTHQLERIKQIFKLTYQEMIIYLLHITTLIRRKVRRRRDYIHRVLSIIPHRRERQYQ